MGRKMVLGLIVLVTVTGSALADWKSEANARIEQIRKRDAKIKVVDQNGRPVSGVTVNINQKKHQFGFGSAIHYQANQDYYVKFKDFFEWAVPANELKWGHQEPNQADYHYVEGDFLVNYCNTNGIKVRAHNVFWAGSLPNWVWPLEGTALQSAMNSRINQVVNRYENKVQHWDVCNEILGSTVFEDRLGSGVYNWMHQRVRQEDPTVKMFVNENGAENSDTRMAQLVSLIQRLQSSGVEINGIGLQGHVAYLDPYVLKGRFDTLSQFGIPIWITEYDCDATDPNAQADYLEILCRTAFSHPSVEGVMLWGFWANCIDKPQSALVNADWSLRPMGQRYFDMLNEWTTNTSGVTDSNGEVTFRGFHGTYQMALSKNGATLGTQTVELTSGTGQAEFVLSSPIMIDDFADGVLDTTMWDTSRNLGGTIAESVGRLSVTSAGSSAPAVLYGQKMVYPTGDGEVTLNMTANMGDFAKGNQIGLSSSGYANFIVAYIGDDYADLQVHMRKGGGAVQSLSVGSGDLNRDTTFTIKWSANRVVISRAGAIVLDTSVNTTDSNGQPWQIPTIPMSFYAQSGYNANSVSFSKVEMVKAGDVKISTLAASDDFEDGALDAAKWITIGNLGTLTEAGGNLCVASINSGSMGQVESTYSVRPGTDGMVVLSSSGLNMGFWQKYNRWGFTNATDSEQLRLIMTDAYGNLAIEMRTNGGTLQTFDLGTGSLNALMPYAIYWMNNRVIVVRSESVIFDSTVNTVDSAGVAWRIPASPMMVCVQSGYNNNSVTMKDMRVDVAGTGEVLEKVFADDFEDGAINSTIWDTSTNAGTLTESGGILTVRSNSSASQGKIVSKALVDVADGKTAMLSSYGINLGFYLKGNHFGFGSDDNANYICLYTDDNSGDLMLYIRSNGGTAQAIRLAGGSLNSLISHTIQWSADRVVVTRGATVAFDSTVNTVDSNNAPWVIPTAPMRAYVQSGWNTNSVSLTDMTLQLTKVAASEPVVQPVLEVTPVTQNAPATAGSTTFGVTNAGTGDMNWTAQVITGSDWLTVNPTNGVNGGTITASFTANTGSADRTATIRITAQGATGSPIDVTVVQAKRILLVGDCDGNGKVDYADFVTLKSNFGRTGMGWAQGDFDGNNKVDYTDFVSLKANFGKTGGVSASQMAQFQAAAEAFESAFAPQEAAQEAQETVQSTVPCSPLGLILMSIIGLALYSLSSLREQE